MLTKIADWISDYWVLFALGAVVVAVALLCLYAYALMDACSKGPQFCV